MWSDENWGRETIKSCIDDCDDTTQKYEYANREQIAIVRKSLVELLALPDEQRDPCLKDYDGEHPEKYPPTFEVVKM